MKLQKNTFFIVMLTLLHTVQASEHGVKRKYEALPSSTLNVIKKLTQKKKACQEKLNETWNQCRMNNFLTSTCTEDELIPGFYHTVHRDAQELLPYKNIMLIIEYCVRYTFSATGQRWDLTHLRRLLNLPDEVPFNQPFGLIKISEKYLWIAAQRHLGYQTFKIPLAKGGKVSYSYGSFTPLDLDRHARCSEGILTRFNSEIQLRSLKNGNMLASCHDLPIGCLHAINPHYMVAQLFLPGTKKTEDQIFIINRTSPLSYVALKDQATQRPLNIYGAVPENVVLCQPADTKYPCVVVFHITKDHTRLMDIFEVTHGNHLTRIVNPGKLLYASDDNQSIVCARNPQESTFQGFSHIIRYAIPSGKITSQSNLTAYIDDEDPIQERTYVMSAYRKKPKIKEMENFALGIHPTYGKPLVLVKNTKNYSIQQNIANKRGDIAAILENLKTGEQQLIVWRVT
jgi:hypothetical protein